MAEPFYVGIDVHKRSWSVSCIHRGELLFRHRQEPSVATLHQILHRNGAEPSTSQLVYEVGPSGFWLYDELTALGYSVLVVSPSLVPRAPGQRVKTDSIDSRSLAVKLAAGMLKGIEVPSVERRAMRDLVRTRGQLVRQRGNLIRMVKSKLLFLNLPYPMGRWTSSSREKILGLEMREEHRVAIGYLVESIESLCEQIRGIEGEIEGVLSGSEYEAKRALLESIPGIGRHGSRTILVELGDLGRFGNGERLSSYLGLTPSEYSSGESIRRGNITRRGNGVVRALLVEAAWTAIRRDPARRRFYTRLAARIGGKRAIVAVARKLTLIIYRMLTTGEFYRWEEEPQTS
jgi:transposase